MWLMNEVAYLGPVYDSWFKAQNPVLGTNYPFSGSHFNSTQYVTDLPANPMGCTERLQWCKDEGTICTELTGSTVGGLDAVLKSVPEQLDLNQRQIAIFNRIYNSTWNTGMYFIWNAVTSDTLLASGLSSSGTVPQLPNNQWVLEANHCEYGFFGLASC